MRTTLVLVALLVGCGDKHAADDDMAVQDLSAASHDLAVSSGDLSTNMSDAAQPACVTPSSPQACAPPSGTTVPVCTLALTGCMDAAKPTQMTSLATYYEVNSPLWSDGAAKMRGFVLPAGGKIHVKDCSSPSADCTAPNGIPEGPADTGRWVFPVGTVMIKSFELDGKLVETRLLMHVDAATAALFANGTDWVGFTYQWNEAQTEATLVPDERTTIQFDTGARTVTWNFPSRVDCASCHSASLGTLGTETAQLNRTVNAANQIDTFVAAGFFDATAPQKPYAGPLVEPYANASLGLVGPPTGTTAETAARSYLNANCSFCHRPDVIDLGFDFRWQLTFAQTSICNRAEQSTIPGMSSMKYVDFAPGNHASSAMWIRMNIPVPASDPQEETNVGRMPAIASYVVDPQAVDLIAQWIDGTTTCP